jgi:hypothetical protein
MSSAKFCYRIIEKEDKYTHTITGSKDEEEKKHTDLTDKHIAKKKLIVYTALIEIEWSLYFEKLK